jgi:glutamyl-tRNA synthetase
MKPPPRVRIAPSPTGTPHVGTAYIALFNRALARRHGGQFILRIEDTDQSRSRPEYEQSIMDALRWLGLDWDEGPDIGGDKGPYRQSERKELYGEYAQQLIDSGHAYKCWCTKERLDLLAKRQRAEKGKLGYDKHCLHLSDDERAAKEASGEPYVVRFNFPADGETRYVDHFRGEIRWDNSDLTDYVLLKSDGMPTYHLANIVDDHLMGITHVIRAEEWLASMPLHWRLYDAFGWDRPVFCHMPLLRNQDGSKISKRKNPVSIDFYRRLGVTPAALLNFLALQGYSLGDDREFFTPGEFEETFDLERVKTSGPVFDVEKLKHINGQHLRAMSAEERKSAILDHVGEWIDRLGELATDRMDFLSDYAANNAYFPAWDVPISKESFQPATKRIEPEPLAKALDDYKKAILNLQPHEWTQEHLEAPAKEIQDAAGWTAKKDRTAWMQAIRITISGRTFTPPLWETLEVMDRFTVVKRLDAAVLTLRAR